MTPEGKINCDYFFKGEANVIASSCMKSADPKKKEKNEPEKPKNDASQMSQEILPSFDFNFSPLKRRKKSVNEALSVRSLNFKNTNAAEIKKLEMMSIELDDNCLGNSVITNSQFKSIHNALLSQRDKTVKADSRSFKISENSLYSKTIKKQRRPKRFSRRINFNNFQHIFKPKEMDNKPLSLDNYAPINLPIKSNFNFEPPEIPRAYRLNWEAEDYMCMEFKAMRREVEETLNEIVDQHLGRFDKNPNRNRLDNFTEFSKSSLSNRDFESFKGSVEYQSSKFNTFSTFKKKKSWVNPNVHSNADTAKKPTKIEEKLYAESKVEDSMYLGSTVKNHRARDDSNSEDPKASLNRQTNLMIRNSKLPKTKEKGFRKQLLEALTNVMRYTESDKRIPYSMNEMIFYFKMGLPFNQKKINLVSKSVKMQLIFFLFSDYIDKEEVLEKFNALETFDRLKYEIQKNKKREILLDIYIKTENEKNLEEFFLPMNNKKEVAPPKVMAEIIHLVLVLFLSMLDLMKIFINHKLDTKLYKEQPYYIQYERYLSKRKSSIKLRELEICDSVHKLSINELLQKIKIEDLFNYMLFNKTVIKFKQRIPIHFSKGHKNQIHNIDLTLNEQKIFFCHRKKRQCTFTKFMFKFIKKNIFRAYKNESMVNREQPHKLILMQFNDQYLLDGENKKMFYTDNINKSALLRFKHMKAKINGKLKEYIEGKCVFDLVDKFYKIFSNMPLKKKQNIQEFIKYFVFQSHNKSFLFEECEISVEILYEIFCYSKF